VAQAVPGHEGLSHALFGGGPVQMGKNHMRMLAEHSAFSAH
jgi:hypothetical protein